MIEAMAPVNRRGERPNPWFSGPFSAARETVPRTQPSIYRLQTRKQGGEQFLIGLQHDITR